MKYCEMMRAFAAADFENPRLEADYLAEKFGADVPDEVVKKRLSHYPLQYLLGEWGFYRESYEVNPHCLTPRADTEHLVEAAVELLPQGGVFLDLCTGSGCVAISTLAARPDTTAVAVDLFPETLAVAARNAVKNGVAPRVKFLLRDVLKGDCQGIYPPNGTGFSAVLANPPYLSKEDMKHLQTEVSYEPAAALAGGEDGMDFYRAMLTHWEKLLTEEGFFLFEIGYDQGESIRTLAAAHGFAATVRKDYGGKDRVALLTRTP